jgi:pimeloyl-ACP methyl ester carboxylesterase
MPDGVTRHEVSFEGPNGPMRAWVLRPEHRAPSGRLFVIHGLHFLGPEDPRLLRFLSAVAASGVEVFAPFIPTLLSLKLEEAAVAETAAALKAATIDAPSGRIGIFTISFGSALGLRLMADPRFQEHTGDLMLFGGYCDWKDALRYSITDRDTRHDVVPPDPLNQPAVYMNLVEDMEGAPTDTQHLHAAWMAYVKATWGDPAMRDIARFEPIARKLAETLADDERPLFLRGCGLGEGAYQEVEGALSRSEARLAWLAPHDDLARLSCTLHIAHGADDDVVPVRHAAALADAATSCPKVTRAVTGIYGHTEHVGIGGLLKRGPAAFQELRTIVGLLHAITSVSHPPHRAP